MTPPCPAEAMRDALKRVSDFIGEIRYSHAPGIHGELCEQLLFIRQALSLPPCSAAKEAEGLRKDVEAQTMATYKAEAEVARLKEDVQGRIAIIRGYQENKHLLEARLAALTKGPEDEKVREALKCAENECSHPDDSYCQGDAGPIMAATLRALQAKLNQAEAERAAAQERIKTLEAR